MLWIKIDMVNATKGYCFSKDRPFETCHENLGDLYRAMVREYGRCTSKMYTDRGVKPAMCVGWVFVKRAKYNDANETYLQETWVAVVDGPEVVKRTVNYVDVEA